MKNTLVLIIGAIILLSMFSGCRRYSTGYYPHYYRHSPVIVHNHYYRQPTIVHNHYH